MVKLNKELVEALQGYINKPLDGMASKVHKWLGGTVKEVSENEVKFEFQVREDMLNPIQSLHGGIHALILDEMMGLVVFLIGNQQVYVAVNLSVDFLNAVHIGEKVVAIARVVRAGRQMAHAECLIYNELGVVVSKGCSNFARITPK